MPGWRSIGSLPAPHRRICGRRGSAGLFCGVYGEGLSWAGSSCLTLQPKAPGPCSVKPVELVGQAGRSCSGPQAWLEALGVRRICTLVDTVVGGGTRLSGGSGGVDLGQLAEVMSGQGAWPAPPRLRGHTPAPRLPPAQVKMALTAGMRLPARALLRACA